MGVEDRLREFGLDLPPPPAPVAAYVGFRRAGSIVYTAGQVPFPTTKRGMVGKDLTVEEGYRAAREVCLNCLAQLKAAIGDLDRVEQVLQVVGFVNSAQGFMDQPRVLNGFTELLVELFGPERGKPTRAALPVHHPGRVAVEAWMVVELKE